MSNINHSPIPSEELLLKQLERERLQFELSTEESLEERQQRRETFQHEEGGRRYLAELAKKKARKDYSSTTGGSTLESLMVEGVAAELAQSFITTEKTVGINLAKVMAAYNKTQNLPLFDGKTEDHALDEDGNLRRVSVFDCEKASLIAIRLAISTCRMPLFTNDESRRGRKDGARPTLQQLEQEIGRHLETQLIVDYAMTAFPAGKQGGLGLVKTLLKYAYHDRAGLGQKAFNTREKFSKVAEGGLLPGLFNWRPWSDGDKGIMGNHILGIVAHHSFEECPDGLFTQETVNAYRNGGWKTIACLALTPEAAELADHLDLKAADKAYLELPMLHAPLPHTKGQGGGYHQVQVAGQKSAIKATYKADMALSDGHLEFQNQQQNVPLRINRWIYDLLMEVSELPYNARTIGSFSGPVRVDDIVTVHLPSDLLEQKRESMKRGQPFSDPHDQERWDCAKRIRKSQFAEFYQLDREVSQSMSRQTLEAAGMCLNDERFFVVVEGDFRGRFYCSSGPLNYQGRDYQKALLEFADPVAVDDRTEYWLRLSMAGDMGFDKCSYQERLAVIDRFREQIIASVRDPIGYDWWKDKANVEKPWQWLAVAREWVRLFVDHIGPRETHCRVQVDATCSGQQICAGWLQCQTTAEQVNLVACDRPGDIYGSVLDVANASIAANNYLIEAAYKTSFKDGRKKRKPILKRRLKALAATDPVLRKGPRKGSKGILMVGQYGAGKKRRIAEFSATCRLPGLPSGEDKFTFEEASALYPHFELGLKQCVPALDEVLAWVKAVTKAALTRPDAPNYLLIPLPDGSVIKQHYPQQLRRRIDLIHMGSKRLRRQGSVLEPTKIPDLSKHMTSTCANLVHGGDSSVLVFALRDCGVPFTTNHDSISGRPSKEMDLIQERFREGLYEVFQNSPLERFITLNGLDPKDFPVPFVGTYDITQVLTATYACC